MTEHQIMKLGHQGDGIAEGPVYAPLTVPGDLVSGQQTGDRLTDIRVSKPSDLRVKPNCRHFKSCGGCSLQHIAADYVGKWKGQVVQDALMALGIETHIRPTLTSPAASRRRATFAARRTKSGAMAGFHARGSDTIIAIPDCQLLTPGLMAALPLCEMLAVEGASRKHALDVTVTETQSGLDVMVSGGKPADAALRATLARLSETFRLTRLVWSDETAALRAPSLVSFDGIDVPLPPGAFLQATSHGEQSLRQAVFEIVHGAQQITDLFAGCGTFGLPLARQAEILAVEGDAGMTKALEQGWRHATGVKTLKTQVRDLFESPLQPEELRKSDAIVIDPPRAGAAAQIAEIARSSATRIAYVSCNPQSFARDARVLIDAGFKLDWVQPVDQFRWSAHVELAGAFLR